MRLIITNGQSGIDALRNAGIEGRFLSWDDVLHDGPVQAVASLDELSELRAGFIASLGWGMLYTVVARFRERDAVLAKAAEFDEVVLFFEHDLYDQLQLLQVLAYAGSLCQFTLASPPTFLGHATNTELLAAYASRRPVLSRDIEYASRAWEAFTSPRPDELIAVLKDDRAPLHHVPAAFRRLVQEYPDSRDGLSRTERQILFELKKGPGRPGGIFQASQQQEEAVFMGDWSFWTRLDALRSGPLPLLEIEPASSTHLHPDDIDEWLETRFCLTPAGRSVLDGSDRWLRSGAIDRWIGGVRVWSKALWCWDSASERFLMVEA